MIELSALIKRNCKLFFKDKAMFFTSLITPAILLVLYVTFLKRTFSDGLVGFIPELDGTEALEALVGGELLSSLLSVCCITVAFCSNLLMVADKVSGARRDLTVTPVKKSTLAMGYYISSFISTLIINITALLLGFLYLVSVGWYLSFADVLGLLLDITLLSLFGTALSSVLHVFLSSQGQMSAVGTVVSAGYGFICGAYMPVSSYSETLQKILVFLPGTYGTSLLRNHAISGVIDSMTEYPDEALDNIKKSMDLSVSFFDHDVGIGAMYLILSLSVALLVAVFIVINLLRKERG